MVEVTTAAGADATGCSVVDAGTEALVVEGVALALGATRASSEGMVGVVAAGGRLAAPTTGCEEAGRL